MTSDQTGLRAAGAWLAGASLLLVLALAFHGPLHPNLQVQMTRIAESASKWAVVHWTAAASFSCFAVAAIIVLVSGSRLTSTGKMMSAWAVVLVGALWTLTTAGTEVTVIAGLAASRDLSQFTAWCHSQRATGTGSRFVLSEVTQSIDILWYEDPANFRRLVRHVDRIVVRPVMARGYFNGSSREIQLSGALVTARNANDVVLTLVHEITHARIAVSGIRSLTREQRSREEAACEKRVRAFIGRMAKVDDRWQEHLEFRRRSPLPESLSCGALWELAQNDKLAGLKHYEAPEWLIRFVRRGIDGSRGAKASTTRSDSE